jgi:hypothetical protein
MVEFLRTDRGRLPRCRKRAATTHPDEPPVKRARYQVSLCSNHPKYLFYTAPSNIIKYI